MAAGREKSGSDPDLFPQLIMVGDDRFPFAPGKQPQMRRVRFRPLGCWPLTAAIDSDADTLEAVIAETFNARSS